MKNKHNSLRIFLITIFLFMGLVGESQAEFGTPFWSMYVGNYWTYSGNYSEEIKPKGTSPCSATQYKVEVLEGTAPWVTACLEISLTSIKLCRLEFYNSSLSAWVKIVPTSTCPTLLKNPITGNWTESNIDVTVTIGSTTLPGTFKLTSSVTLSPEDVTIGLGDYKAYKVYAVQSVTVPLYGTITKEGYGWFVPYLGVIKVEEGGDSEELTSMIIKKDTVDFNANAKTDLIWYNTSSGYTYAWLMDGYDITSENSPGVDTDLNWQIKGGGDFDGDGKTDIFWQNTSTGWTRIWFMDGTTKSSEEDIEQVGLGWQIKGIGDFDGDGKADVLWQDSASGWTLIWFMDGATKTSTGAPALVGDPAWQIKKVGDFNGDGKSDILWLNTTSGWTFIWLMDGATITSGGAPALVGDANWQIKEAADFNGDGKADILWQNTSTGWTYIWFMDGTTISSGGAPALVGDSNWQIKCVGDFDGDGKWDVFWQHTTEGWTYIWFMDGSTILSTGIEVPGVVSDTNWQIMN